MTVSDTIFALASATGRAGVSVFRISGPEARRALTLCPPEPIARHATIRTLKSQSGDAIDRALILWLPAPATFTGEDTVEFHTHGGRAIRLRLEEALLDLGFRPAEPGEFARKAFENGKLDLTEAEAIADLVDAETEAQRRQALTQMQGALGTIYETWRSRLLRSLAYLEAAIDFADEDLPEDLASRQGGELRQLTDEMIAHLNDGHRGERLRSGLTIAILGPPNAGKSSLLNALARREAAIVSPIAGTTRDIIEVHLDLGGWPMTLADTAGLHETADPIEKEGIRRALARADAAELKLLLTDATEKMQERPFKENLSGTFGENTVHIATKADLLPASLPQGKGTQDHPLLISAKTGLGLSELTDLLIGRIQDRFAESASPPLTRARHRSSLEDCVRSLERALAQIETELRAEDVRLAARALGRITGRVDVEDVLDVIFRDFCIGK